MSDQSGIEFMAMFFATNVHAGQVRKYTGEPYINHPAEVVEIVRRVGGTDEMLAAAWLHDVVEDCGVSLEAIRDRFGPVVGDLVEDLTDVSRKQDGNRAKRKAMDREHTANASAEAQTIKLADLISNSKSIKERDPEFAKVYLAEKRQLLAVMTKGSRELWEQAERLARE